MFTEGENIFLIKLFFTVPLYKLIQEYLKGYKDTSFPSNEDVQGKISDIVREHHMN